jgi:hypothetical protein
MSDFALHLVVEDVPAAIDFYERAFGAQVTRVLHLPDASVAIAELDVEGLPATSWTRRGTAGPSTSRCARSRWRRSRRSSRGCSSARTDEAAATWGDTMPR